MKHPVFFKGQSMKFPRLLTLEYLFNHLYSWVPTHLLNQSQIDKVNELCLLTISWVILMQINVPDLLEHNLSI